MSNQISAIIITKNEADMIESCINNLGWCDEILLIDDNSTDKTVAIAENLGAKVVAFSHSSFARKRQEGLKRAKHDWLFYVDADERVTPQLAKEIKVNIETNTADAFSLERKNIFYGTYLSHGGWEKDVVERVFKRSCLKGWLGSIHESPEYNGAIKKLATQLIHLSHRDTISGLKKTIAWTPLEVSEYIKTDLPTVTVKTILRKGIMEFFRRGVLKKGYKDGQVGLIEAIIQGINRMLVYIQIWEEQQKPPIHARYNEIEKEIEDLWQKEK